MPPALRIETIWKSYVAGVRGCSARVWVLRGLSLTIEHGERVAVIGAPGAGKSTLATCILGLRRPDAGLVEAPGIASGALAVIGPGLRFEPNRPSATLLLLTGEVACIEGRTDRVLVLRDGRLHSIDVRIPARRVAERVIGER